MGNSRRKWQLNLLMSMGICVAYIERTNISHAIIPLSEDLSLSSIQQGLILSAFAWGYVLAMGFGGILVDRIGAIRAAAFSGLAWSLTTIVSGFANTFSSLVVWRVGVGASESPIFPANARLVRESFDLDERGRATAIFDAGSYVGIALSAPIMVYVIALGGWRVAFVTCGVLGLVWTWSWIRYAPRWAIREHTTTSKASVDKQTRLVIWQLIRDRRVFGASIGFFCYNYAKSFYLTWLPSYLVSQRGFSFLEVGFIAILPPISAIGGDLISGFATDYMIMRGVSVSVARRVPICAGMVLGGSIGLAAYVDSKFLVVGLLSFSFAMIIAASPGIWAIPGDIAPSTNLVGTIGGIQNTFSNVAGIIAPLITGVIVAQTGRFDLALMLTAVIAIGGALAYWRLVTPLTPIQVSL